VKKQESKKYKFFTILSFISLSIPVGIFMLRIFAASRFNNHTERVSLFKSYFPEALHGRWDTTIISLICSLIAIVLSSFCLVKHKNLWNVFNHIVFIGACLLFALNLFSMM
jgi:hypothetical protein